MTVADPEVLDDEPVVLAEEEPEEEKVDPLPPPSLPATPVTAEDLEKWVPGSPKSLMRKLEKAGWWCRMTKARGPRIQAGGKVKDYDSRTLAVAAQSPEGERLVWFWRWMPTSGKWVTDGAHDGRTGALLGHEEAKARIR